MKERVYRQTPDVVQCVRCARVLPRARAVRVLGPKPDWGDSDYPTGTVYYYCDDCAAEREET